jgi:hypothetical protein
VQQSGDYSGLSLLAVRTANILGKPFGIAPFPRAFPSSQAGQQDRSAVFDGIYRANSWGSSESRSGLGSETRYARRFVQRLRACLDERSLHRLFDAPCGDLNWVLPLARDPAVGYQGGDISAALITDLKARYPDLKLGTFDICVDPLPDADVWLCRDCLFHLPFADIRMALGNFTRSSIPYALLTTHSARLLRNLDVPAGGFRYLDLERPPISLPPALTYLKDYRLGRDFPRYVGLWPREAIAEACARW